MAVVVIRQQNVLVVMKLILLLILLDVGVSVGVGDPLLVVIANQ
jgi:hypothetical protein